jgi:hypothetical protein
MTGPGSVVLTNVSPWALRVHSPVGGVRVEQRRSSTSLADVTIDQLMATAVGDPSDGSVLVGPGASAVYGADLAAGVGVRYDARYTGGRYATDAAVKWIEGKATPRGRAAADSVVACGKSVGDIWTNSRTGVPLDEVLLSSMSTVGTCRSMVTTLQEIDNAPQPATVAEEVKTIAKGIGKSFWDDLAKYGPRALATVR